MVGNLLKNDKILLSFASEYEYGNFGDLLSRYIVERLSGKSVVKYQYKPVLPHFCAIGSILNRNEICSPAFVWGSGFISPQNKYKIKFTAIRQILRGSFGKPYFYAVRGKLTRNILLESGFECPEVYGDPALLMPFLYKPQRIVKKYRLGIICHNAHEQLPEFLAGNLNGVLKIPINRHYKKITEFIEEVCSCDIIISSSLHGLIIANAYGVPVVRMVVKGHSLHPNKSDESRQDFKFKDYLSGLNALSVGSNSSPYEFSCLYFNDDQKLTEELVNLIVENATKPSFSWSLKSLLQAFPYINSNVISKIYK